jgi:hypothetical protein
MQAYLIDPSARTVEPVEVEYSDDNPPCAVIGNGCTDVYAVSLDQTAEDGSPTARDVVFVDEDGPVKPGLKSFRVVGTGVALFGRGLVLAGDLDGIDPPVSTIEEVRQRIQWL